MTGAAKNDWLFNVMDNMNIICKGQDEKFYDSSWIFYFSKFGWREALFSNVAHHQLAAMKTNDITHW